MAERFSGRAPHGRGSSRGGDYQSRFDRASEQINPVYHQQCKQNAPDGTYSHGKEINDHGQSRGEQRHQDPHRSYQKREGHQELRDLGHQRYDGHQQRQNQGHQNYEGHQERRNLGQQKYEGPQERRNQGGHQEKRDQGYQRHEVYQDGKNQDLQRFEGHHEKRDQGRQRHEGPQDRRNQGHQRYEGHQEKKDQVHQRREAYQEGKYQGHQTYGDRQERGGQSREKNEGFQDRSNQGHQERRDQGVQRNEGHRERKDEGYHQIPGHKTHLEMMKFADGFSNVDSMEERLRTLGVKKEIGSQLFLVGRRGNLAITCPNGNSNEVSQYRPAKRGTLGRKVELSTNLFNFGLTRNGQFHQYTVDFSPNIESTRLQRKLIKTLEGIIGMTSKYVTDGSRIFTPLLLDESVLKNLTAATKTTQYKVTIKHTGSVDSNSGHAIQILNVIFGSLLQNVLGWKWTSGNYYDVSVMHRINNTSLSVYAGFFSSILEYEHGTRLMLDVSHKVISSETALEYIKRDGGSGSSIIGRIVYTSFNNRTYKVDDVDRTKNPSFTFNYRNREISIADYYKEKYNAAIQDMKQPLLCVIPKKKEVRAGAPDVILLVPELCLITGISEDVKKNFTMMKALGDVTKVSPQERVKKMQHLVQHLKKDEEAKNIFDAFGISLSPDMCSLTGRVLPDINATQDLKGVTRYSLLYPIHLKKWAILYPTNTEQTLQTFSGYLSEACKSMGMTWSKPDMFQYTRQELFRNIKELRDYEMVLVIVNGTKAEYDAVKMQFCVSSAIPSQVMTLRTLKNKNIRTISSKVALQMNCKAGGAGWSIRNMNAKDTMIIGVDTYHDSNRKGSSYAGIVASLDDCCSKYFTTWARHDTGKEISTSFRSLISECMEAYFRHNRRPCKRIIIYRDGVGDGQLTYLESAEVKEAERAIVDMQWKDTKLVYIVVKKRINSKFFVRQGNEFTNARKGTVIDNEATRPNWVDFFLINQEAHQGSVTPTHFNVILNSSNMSIDEIQLLTYQLCFMYYNWNDSIRVPAHCQYAHKVAFLIGQSLHQDPNKEMKKCLFYL